MVNVPNVVEINCQINFIFLSVYCVWSSWIGWKREICRWGCFLAECLIPFITSNCLNKEDYLNILISFTLPFLATCPSKSGHFSSFSTSFWWYQSSSPARNSSNASLLVFITIISYDVSRHEFFVHPCSFPSSNYEKSAKWPVYPLGLSQLEQQFSTGKSEFG